MTFPMVDGYRTLELGTPGAMRAELNRLVLQGQKRATAGLAAEYLEEDEPIESVGERLALVDDDLNRIAIIEVTEVVPTTFGEVTWDFAQAEGEGFADLADWREQHRRYWASVGREIEDSTLLACIYFEVVRPDLQG